MEKFTCPVRDYRTNNQGENDKWVIDSNGVITCSYCKSLNPSSLVNLIQIHGKQIVQRGRKPYVFYIKVYGVEYHYYSSHNTENFKEELEKLLHQ